MIEVVEALMEVGALIKETHRETVCMAPSLTMERGEINVVPAPRGLGIGRHRGYDPGTIVLRLAEE